MRMWGRAACGSVAGAMAWVGVAAAQESPAFPASLDREPLLFWMQRETDILPERVVAVTPQALTSIVSTFPASAGQPPRVIIRAEALNAETFARTGSLSWHVSLSADCTGQRVRLGETTGYPQRNLLGERRQLREAETEWRPPGRGTALESAWRAACEADFKGPFGARSVRVAQEAAPAAASAPEPSKAAPKPAAPASAARAGALVAQVGASPSDADARSLIAGLGSRLGGREAWVEKADVGGRTWYRAVVGGFATSSDANDFCAGLKAAGRGCFVRSASR